MGLVEVLPHLRRILARIRETADDIVRKNPDVVVTIDSPSFTVRVITQLVGRYRTENPRSRANGLGLASRTRAQIQEILRPSSDHSSI